MRVAAGFVPLALAVVLGNAVMPSSNKTEILARPNAAEAAVCADEIVDFRDCHTEYPTGCSKSAKYDPYLNLLKNSLVHDRSAVRFVTSLPEFQKLDSDLATVAPSLTKNKHAQFKDELGKLGEGQIFGAVGYLYYAQPTGAESANCQLVAPDDTDFHIGIGFDPDLAAIAAKGHLSAAERTRLTHSAVVVEMTPHYRASLQPNWTLEELKAVVGRKVRVEGQLMLDSEHYVRSQDCAMEGADQTLCWRASAWELHPVTKFQVCSGTDCGVETAGWVELEDASKTPATVAKTRATGPRGGSSASSDR